MYHLIFHIEFTCLTFMLHDFFASASVMTKIANLKIRTHLNSKIAIFVCTASTIYMYTIVASIEQSHFLPSLLERIMTHYFRAGWALLSARF